MKNKLFKNIACLALAGLVFAPASVFASEPPTTYNIGDGVLSTLPAGSPKIEDQGYGKDKKEDIVRINQDVRVNVALLIKAGAENIRLRFWKDETDRREGYSSSSSRNTPLLYTLDIKQVKTDSGDKKAGEVWQSFKRFKDYDSSQSELAENSKKLIEETDGEMFAEIKHFDPGDLWLEITYKLNGENKKQTIHMYVDPEDRFLGEVKGSDFINGVNLAKLIGLSAGTNINGNIENQWLKYQQGDGTITYVAKTPMKNYISWDSINSAGAVFGKDIDINDKNYKVRLLKGSNGEDNPSNYDRLAGYKNIGSEWNRLLYPVSHHTSASENQSFYYGGNVGARIPHWASFNFTDLGLVSYKGEYSWCQESVKGDSYRLDRGDDAPGGVSNSSSGDPSSGHDGRGWRPAVDFLPQ